jgi:hypothetical protein
MLCTLCYHFMMDTRCIESGKEYTFDTAAAQLFAGGAGAVNANGEPTDPTAVMEVSDSPILLSNYTLLQCMYHSIGAILRVLQLSQSIAAIYHRVLQLSMLSPLLRAAEAPVLVQQQGPTSTVLLLTLVVLSTDTVVLSTAAACALLSLSLLQRLLLSLLLFRAVALMLRLLLFVYVVSTRRL